MGDEERYVFDNVTKRIFTYGAVRKAINNFLEKGDVGDGFYVHFEIMRPISENNTFSSDFFKIVDKDSDNQEEEEH